MSNSTKETKENLIGRGLEHIFGRSYYSREEHVQKLRKNLISYPEILADHYKAIDNDASLNEVFSTAKTHDIDLYSIPFWKKKICSLTDDVSKTPEEYSQDIWWGNSDYIISAASMIPDFDWQNLFKELSNHQNHQNYLRAAYTKVATNFSKTSPSKFKVHVDENLFFLSGKKPSYVVRGLMYQLYVKSGFLTKKTARKIRSDGSEDSSVSGVKALTENIDLYTNQDELLLQFTDSKYESVICHLADHLPEHLIPSIMGTEFWYAKRKIENRLEAIEARKIEEKNGQLPVAD
jgi:hypothetical protein